MTRTNESGQTILYAMEPAEELAILRTLKRRRTCMSKPSPSYWIDNVYPLEDQAERIGLKGGYDPIVIQLLWTFTQEKIK